MSKFVNYKKRSITLPAGSKNLIDILQGGGAAQFVPEIPHRPGCPFGPSTVTRSETGTGYISDIEKDMGMVFESRVWCFTLAIFPPNRRAAIGIHRLEDAWMCASVAVQFDTEVERAVRRFFVLRGLPVPEDSEICPRNSFPICQFRSITKSHPFHPKHQFFQSL